jgi:hypothetical protein
MNVIPSMKGVLHLRFPTQLEASTALCRLDQFSEGPEEYRGKYFTHEDWKPEWERLLAQGIDYFNYYEGWNIPSSVAQDFFELYNDLTAAEDNLYAAWRHAGYPYLIVDFEGADPTVVDHELAHARWALDIVYRLAMKIMILQIPTVTHSLICKDLVAAGYPSSFKILNDEMHAYLLTSTDEELLDVFKSVPLVICRHWREVLRQQAVYFSSQV